MEPEFTWLPLSLDHLPPFRIDHIRACLPLDPANYKIHHLATILLLCLIIEDITVPLELVNRKLHFLAPFRIMCTRAKLASDLALVSCINPRELKAIYLHLIPHSR